MVIIVSENTRHNNKLGQEWIGNWINKQDSIRANNCLVIHEWGLNVVAFPSDGCLVSSSIEGWWNGRMGTWGLEGIGVGEAVRTEFNSSGWQLRDIYINQSPNHYSPESLNRYSGSCIHLLWRKSGKEDLFIHQYIQSHFALSMCSCSCRVHLLFLFGHHDYHQLEHYHQVEWIGVLANLNHNPSIQSLSNKIDWQFSKTWSPNLMDRSWERSTNSVHSLKQTSQWKGWSIRETPITNHNGFE